MHLQASDLVQTSGEQKNVLGVSLSGWEKSNTDAWDE